MRFILALFVLLSSVSCGENEKLKIVHNNDRVSNLEARVLVLEQTSATKTEVQNLMNLLANLQSDVNVLTSEFGALVFEMRDQLDSLELELSAIQIALSSAESDVEALRDDLASIQVNVTNIITQQLNVDGCLVSLNIMRQNNNVISDVQLQFNCAN